MFTVLVKKDDNAFPFGLVTSRQRLNSLMKYESRLNLAERVMSLESGVILNDYQTCSCGAMRAFEISTFVDLILRIFIFFIP